MIDPKTVQRVVERFLTAYTLEDEPKSGRPRALSETNRTKLKEHMDENPGTSVWRPTQELGHKCETVHTTLKEEGYFPYRNSVLHELKREDYAPWYNIVPGFSRNLAAMLKQ